MKQEPTLSSHSLQTGTVPMPGHDAGADLPTVAFIRANWHLNIVDRAREGFLAALAEMNGPGMHTDIFDVPGAFEIPLLAKRLAQSGRYEAVIGAAFVVNGGIYRHDFVADTVVSALMQAQMETNVPIFSVVLTPHNYQETTEHTRFFQDHFVTKGREAASAVINTLAVYEQVALAG